MVDFRLTSVWWDVGGPWPLFVTRLDHLELQQVLDTFVHRPDPHGRGIVLL